VRACTEHAVDLVVVRENVEGEYTALGGRFGRLFPDELATQQAIFTRSGVARIVDYALELAATRRRLLTSATKSNGIMHTLVFWDEIVAERAEAYPTVQVKSELIDALCAKLVLQPQTFDVIVGSNLFGDILGDVAAAVAGSIGVASSANLNPEREFPSMFEPVHGSAPDIAGRGIANPLGAIWAGAMMLDHLGHPDAGASVLDAVTRVLARSEVRTPDLGGRATTAEFSSEVRSALSSGRKAAIRDRSQSQ
jgi:tartrate dehydrogenase/decarboxylase/D-malate dehydrogenase